MSDSADLHVRRDPRHPCGCYAAGVWVYADGRVRCRGCGEAWRLSQGEL